MALCALALLGASACSNPSSPTPRISIEPIAIDKVEVLVGQTRPAQVSAHVLGFVGDGCSSLLPTQQSREGRVVQITITRQRRVDATCIQVAEPFDQVIPLAGEFPAGDYLLRVNVVERPFTVN